VATAEELITVVGMPANSDAMRALVVGRSARDGPGSCAAAHASDNQITRNITRGLQNRFCNPGILRVRKVE
jgi:hypothetical protein